MLSIKNLSKSIGDKAIINNCSLQIKRGEIAVLLGPSGVGKSTILRMLNNLETIDGGSIELDGNILELNMVNKNHIIGMVFQHFNLFEHITVEENICLALEHVLHMNKKCAHDIAHQLLNHYGLSHKAHCLISELSGGEKQRLSIARTLALKPTVICMDEPTSALDPLLTTHVAQTIKELAAQGYIIIVATHDISLVEKLPCTIHLMNQGTIIESASSAHFFSDKSHYPHIAAFIAGT